MGFFNETIETATKPELEKYQFSRFKELLKTVAEQNRFYRTKYERAKIDISAIRSIDDIKTLPFTDKKDFENDQLSSPLYGTTLTEALENYVQYHQTTGTTGKPLKMLDTKESWEWRAKCACYILAAAGVTKKDTVLLAFNFGPYTAFWVLYEGAYRTGCLVPFFFLYKPGLTLIGPVLDIAVSVAEGIVATIFISMAVEGYFKRSLNLFERASLLAAGFLLFAPGWYTTLIVLVVAPPLIYLNWYRIKSPVLG